MLETRVRRMPFAVALFAAAAVSALASPAPAQEPPPSALGLERVEVEPATARPDTLCRLAVRIRNGGERTASSFVFRVELDGRELPVYRNQIFMDPVEAGETRSLPLYTFWTDETGRPIPESGEIVVVVTLVEARWTAAERDADGVVVWTDLGAVEGLPASARYVLEIEP